MRLVVAALNAICALFALAVVTVTAAFVLIDPNDYKARIVDAVQDATGRTLTLGGTLTLTRSLWPTLEATDVSLSNLPGGSRPHMVHVERIEGQLALLSLLRHQVDITRLALTGPNILFEQANGQPNWVFTPSGAPNPLPVPVADPETPFSVRVRSATVRNGMITWRLPARTKVVGIRALDFRRKREGGPIDVRSTLVYADNEPFKLDIVATPTGGMMDPWQTRMNFAAFDTTAGAQGTMAVAGAYDLQVEATSETVEKLNALLPEMRLPALRHAMLSAHIGNGAQPGDLPVVGPARLSFTSADLRDRVPGLTFAATKVALPGPGGQAAIDGAGQYAGTGFRLTGSVGVPTHPDGKVSVPVALSMNAAPGKLDGVLTLKGTLALDALKFAGLETAVTVRTAELAAFRTMLGDSVPALDDLRFAAQLSIPAAAGSVRLRNVKLEAAQGDITGEGSIDPAAALALSGSWRSEELDLDAMLAAFGIDLSAGPAASTGPVISNAALPWAMLRRPTLDLTATIAAMHFQGETWRDVQAAVTLKGGRLRAAPVSVAMPGQAGSRMQATLTADAGAAGLPVTLALQAPALPLALLARYAGMPGPVAGTARVDAQWRAQGATLRALAASLTGPFSITSTGGQLTNRALIGLTGPALDGLGISVPPQGETRMDCLGVTGTFANGVGTFRTIALETTYLSLEGTGQVDLGRETLSLKLQPMAPVAGSLVSVPVVVEGPFRSVSGRLDAGGLEQLGFLLDGLFGGDRSRVCEVAGLTKP